MSGKAHIILKRATLGLLICVLGTLLLNRVLFMHAHVMPDGSITCHAHPFDRSQETDTGLSHQHTGLEYTLLENLGLLFFLIVLGLVFRNPFRNRVCVPALPGEMLTLPAIPIRGRAPPLS